jgi:two-component system, NarL family, sensor kinase
MFRRRGLSGRTCPKRAVLRHRPGRDFLSRDARDAHLHDVTVHPPRSAVPDVVAGLLAVAAGLVVIGWQVLGGGPGPTHGPSFSGMAVAFALVYGASGAVLAWHGVATVVRRVLLGIGLAQGGAALAATYADSAVAATPDWPVAGAALWLSSWLWSPAYIAAAALLPLLLPDGRPVWRWAVYFSGAAVAVTAVSWALTPYHLQDFPLVGGPVNPVGVDAAAHPVAVGSVIGLDLLAVAVALASVVVRRRRARGVARDQLRWLLVGVLGTVAVGAAGFIAPPGATEVLPALAVLPLPATCLVALLRHRLWDVDLVLSRSLSYGLLSAAVVGGYVIAVALLGGILGSTADAPVLATAVVALLVLPLHTRLQRLVNRLVHGDAEDPYTALARLGDRLEAATGPAEVADRVLPELVTRIAKVVRAPYVAVELADGSTSATGVRPDQVVTTPLLYGGFAVGSLVVAGSRLPHGERRLLDHLGRQAAVAVHSVLLAREAQRARVATATGREEERRRLRRDLHDGMGPALAAVALQAETARDLVVPDPAAAVALLDRLVPRLNDTVSDIRTLVHDLRPPTLDELGLAGSVRELATRFGTPTRTVSVEAGEMAVLPAAVDLAAYRIVAESLTNAAKHSSASAVQLSLTRSPVALHVRVSDDGVGLVRGGPPGVGLRSMRERAEELGGSCVIGPGEDGRGTTVFAIIPLQRSI